MKALKIIARNVIKSLGIKLSVDIIFFLYILSVSLLISLSSAARVVKLADTPDLGSGAARRGGSSPFSRTIFSY